jgi:hypothetical protein
MVERKPWQQFPGAEKAVKIYTRLRKRFSRRAKAVVVVEEAEEDDMCESANCACDRSRSHQTAISLRNQKSSLNSSTPCLKSIVPLPGSSTSSLTKPRRIPKQGVTVLHEPGLGLCVECRVKCDIHVCMPEVRRPRRVLDDGDFAQDLDKTGSGEGEGSDLVKNNIAKLVFEESLLLACYFWANFLNI